VSELANSGNAQNRNSNNNLDGLQKDKDDATWATKSPPSPTYAVGDGKDYFYRIIKPAITEMIGNSELRTQTQTDSVH
jgi:hypothetical protein